MPHKTWTMKMLLLAMLATLASLAHAQSQAQAGDELIIQQRKDTTHAMAVQIQQKIIVWTADKTRRKGHVTQIDTDSVALDSVKIPLANVTKVRAYSKEIGTERMNSWARRSAWVALGGFLVGLVGTIIVFIPGTASALAILAMVLGVPVFAISFFILLGTIFAQIGANIPATTFRLKKGWQLRVHKMKKPPVKAK